MKYPLTLLTAICGMIITTPAQAISSKTDLSKVGTTVNELNQLLKTTVGDKAKASGLKLPDITTSYVLGQGVTINVAPIKFPKQSDVSPAVESAAQQEQQEAMKIAGTKKAAHRRKAKELAHRAFHLREQSKSLKRSISEATDADKAKFDEQLKKIREQMKATEVERQLHAKAEPKLVELAHNGRQQEKPKADIRLAFYQSLALGVAQSLCQQADLLKAIDDTEKVSIVYQLDHQAQQKGYSVKGWMVEKALLDSCNKGFIDLQYLATNATQYQY